MVCSESVSTRAVNLTRFVRAPSGGKQRTLIGYLKRRGRPTGGGKTHPAANWERPERPSRWTCRRCPRVGA